MKKLLILVLLPLLAVSCTPKAIIVPEVRKLDVKPVAEGAREVDKAVKDVVAANRDSKAATDKLRSSTESLLDAVRRAEAEAVTSKAWREIQEFSRAVSDDLASLTATNVILEERILVADQISGNLLGKVAKLEADKIDQDKSIADNLKAFQAIAKEADDFKKKAYAAEAGWAEEKKKSAFWRKIVLWVVGIGAVFLLIKFFGAAIWAGLRAYNPLAR